MRIEVRVGDLVQRTGDGQAQVEYSVAGQSRCQVTLCAVYNAQRGEECEFLGLASKPRSMVSSGLASKSVATVSLGLASKPVATVFWFGLKTTRSSFLV
jgi:hypothetical protein